jgi:alkanesulfonate monooxygenase SsuD/methylene tetrahydromethanopterin reductase-like flavin-dependent oxidoreductase (luciferase family)
MKYGFIFPGGDARVAAEWTQAAEEAGWDGFFVWDSVWGIDPWVSLAAAAMLTERIRLGTMISPISRRRPWKVAGETATLDRLSNGRLILAVGLGAVDTGFREFGEVTDRKTRAELLDESLDIITGLWQGQPFNYDGKHYQVRESSFLPPPPPVQQPRIPIWVVGAWPRPKSMARVLRYDGLLPNKVDENGVHSRATPEDVGAMSDYVARHHKESSPFDIIVEGATPGDDPVGAGAAVAPWAASGATWWIEAHWDQPDLAPVLARLRQGPPRLP